MNSRIKSSLMSPGATEPARFYRRGVYVVPHNPADKDAAEFSTNAMISPQTEFASSHQGFLPKIANNQMQKYEMFTTHLDLADGSLFPAGNAAMPSHAAVAAKDILRPILNKDLSGQSLGLKQMEQSGDQRWGEQYKTFAGDFRSTATHALSTKKHTDAAMTQGFPQYRMHHRKSSLPRPG